MNSDKSHYNHFDEICDLIKDFYKPSKTDIFDKYFRTQSLGLLSPSEFIIKACDDLEQLQPGSSSNEDILRRSFLAVLPPTVRAILAGSDKSSLADLANIADKVFLNLPNQTVSQIDPSITDLVKNLSDQVTSLQLEIATQRQSRPTSRSHPYINKHRSKSSTVILCTHHFKLKSESTKCCIGCTWSDKSNCTNQTQICVYHDVYSSVAKRCLLGCSFQKTIVKILCQKSCFL